MAMVAYDHIRKILHRLPHSVYVRTTEGIPHLPYKVEVVYLLYLMPVLFKSFASFPHFGWL